MSSKGTQRRGPGQGRGGRAAAGRRSGPPRSRGAGRTGAIRQPGDTKPARSEKGLGGEQVEGRQAVRELLLAQRRKARGGQGDLDRAARH